MFHANGWTFTWIVTAVGGTHVCLRKVEPARVFDADRARAITMLCAAPTVLIGDRQRARRGARRARRAACACSPPARRRPRRPSSASRASSAGTSRRSTASPRPRRSSRSASRGPSTRRSPRRSARAIKARQGVELITSGELRVVDEDGRRGAARRRDGRRDRRARQRRDEGLLRRSRGDASARCAAAGSTPATPPSSIPTATSRSAIASRT